MGAMLEKIQAGMEAELKNQGITAEITFCRTDIFSVLVDDGGQFEKAKRILAGLKVAMFDSEDHDEECGHVAYYRF